MADPTPKLPAAAKISALALVDSRPATTVRFFGRRRQDVDFSDANFADYALTLDCNSAGDLAVVRQFFADRKMSVEAFTFDDTLGGTHKVKLRGQEIRWTLARAADGEQVWRANVVLEGVP